MWHVVKERLPDGRKKWMSRYETPAKAQRSVNSLIAEGYPGDLIVETSETGEAPEDER